MPGWKSPKDREAYISKMQEAGFDQAEIDADVKAIDAQKSVPVAVPPPVLKPSSQAGGGGSPMTQPETAAPSMAAAPAQSVQADLSSLNQARQEQGNSLIDQVINVENAKLIGYPLAAYGAYKLADKALEKSGLKARMFGQTAPVDRTVDIPLEATPENKLPQAAQQKFSPKEAVIEAEINKKFPFTFQEAKKGLGLEGVTVVDPMQAQAVAKQYSNQLQAQAAAVPPQAPKMVWEPPTASLAISAPVSPTPVAEVEKIETPKSVAEEVKQDVKNVQQAANEVVQETKTTKTKTPKPEYFEGFKNLPSTERQILGTFGVANDTERAKTLVNALKSTLPEGAALEFPKSASGVSLGGMANPQDVMSFTNKHLGTEMKLDEKGKFPADFKFTNENLSKMHQSVLKELENAKTPEALAKAQKGMATLGALAGVAGTSLAALGAYSAYKHGKETGDWSDLGKLGIDTAALAGSKTLRAFGGIPYMLATHTGPAGESQDELARLAAANRQAAQVGFGRGIAPPSPRSQVGRR